MKSSESFRRFQNIQSRIFVYILAGSLGIIYLLFQMHHLLQFIDYDQVIYIDNVYNLLDPEKRNILNPHHLHFEAGGAWFHRLIVSILGDLGSIQLPFSLRLRSVFAASLGVAFSFLYFEKISRNKLLAIFGALAVGLTNGYSHYAGKVDTGIFPAAVFPLLLWLRTMLDENRDKGSFYIFGACSSAALFIAVMMHQYMAVACFMFCISLVIPREWYSFSPGTPFRLIAESPSGSSPGIFRRSRLCRNILLAILIGIPAIGMICAAYYTAGRAFYQLPVEEEERGTGKGYWRNLLFQEWLFAYESSGDWGNGLQEFNPVEPFRGYTDAFLAPEDIDRVRYNRVYIFPYRFSGNEGVSSLLEQNDPVTLAFNAMAVLTLISLGGSLILAGPLLRRFRGNFLFLLGSTAGYLVFFTYWEPYYFEFWLIPVICVLSLFIMIVLYFQEKLSAWISMKLPIISHGILGLVLILLFFHNMYFSIVPYSRILQWEGVTRWGIEGVRSWMSDKMFLYPGNRYKEVYGLEPGQIYIIPRDKGE